jgi:hypothetical protein
MLKLRILVLLLTAFIIAMTITVAYASPPVETLRPDADITTAGWSKWGTSHTNYYEYVNEAVADGDTTCLYSVTGVPTYLCLFSLQDISSGYTINSVTVWVVARAWFGSDANLRIVVKTHDTFYPALDDYDPINAKGTQTHLTGTYNAYSRTLTNNPYTNSPWTRDEVNDLQVGIQNSYGANGEEPTFTQLYVEVDVTPQFVVPESPIGAMAALVSAMLAFAAVASYKHTRPKK